MMYISSKSSLPTELHHQELVYSCTHQLYLPFSIIETSNMAVVDAIGVFGTVLTTVGFWQSQFGEKHNEGPTVVIKGM